MREIKFRAWDGIEKAMYGNVEKGNGVANIKLDQYGSISNIKVFKYQQSMKCEFANLSREENEFELMQYTGLKDKNGVEIYEGDVVKTKNSKYKVIFDKCCYWGVDELGKYPIYQIYNYVLDDERFEVIGNIYENPELLHN